MSKETKASRVMRLLKKGYSPKEVTGKMKVSESYAYLVKKMLAENVEVSVEEKVEPKPEPEVSGVGKVLDARAEQYGSFMQSADTVIRIKGIMHNAVARNAVHLYPDQLQALDMIATKISRIVHGNPNHLDSWVDIAGYAQLVADRLQGKVR